MRSLLFLVALVTLTFPASVVSTRYYLSNELGLPDNSGTDPAFPKSVLGPAGVSGVASGDTVLLCQGETWPPVSLTLSVPNVTYSSYNCSCSRTQPVITTSSLVPAAQWSSPNSNNDLVLTAMVQNSASIGAVWVGGVRYLPARYPSLTVSSKPYFTSAADAVLYDRSGSGGSIVRVSPALTQTSGYWNGATLRARSNAYFWYQYPVNSYDSNSGALTLAYDYNTDGGDKQMFLEWTHAAHTASFMPFLAPYTFLIDDQTSTLYLSVPDAAARAGVMSGSIPVWVTPLDISPVVVTAASVTIEGWNITHAAANYLLDARNAQHFTLSSSSVSHAASGSGRCLGCGACIASGADTTVVNSVVDDCEQDAVIVQERSLVHSNIITRTGLITGYTGQTAAVKADGGVYPTNSVVTNNYIGQSGYAGVLIGTMAYNVAVRGNIIVDSMMSLGDGGAIYTYSGGTLGGTSSHFITDNIIDGVMGSYQMLDPAPCMYLDEGSGGITMQNNTCNAALQCMQFNEAAGHYAQSNKCYSSGIFMQNTHAQTRGDQQPLPPGVLIQNYNTAVPTHILFGNTIYYYGLGYFYRYNAIVYSGKQNYAVRFYERATNTQGAGLNDFAYMGSNIYCIQAGNDDVWQVELPASGDAFRAKAFGPATTFDSYLDFVRNYGTVPNPSAEGGSAAYDNRAGAYTSTYCPNPPSSKPAPPVISPPASACSAVTPLSPTFAFPLNSGIDLVSNTNLYTDQFRTTFTVTPTRGNGLLLVEGAGYVATTLSSSYSVCLWVDLFTPGVYGYPSVLFGTDGFLFGLDNSANLFVSRGAPVNNPALYNITFTLPGDLSTAINAWSHCCNTYDAATATLKLYLNGTQVASSVQSGGAGGWAGSSNGARLGNGNSEAYHMNGYMQGLAVWGGAITSQQVQNIYTSQTSGEVGVSDISTYNSLQ